jgi:indoleamine 2,3-dioxygenase
LLEPCDLKYRKTGEYGYGHSILPRQLAIPLTQIAGKMNAKPFMEYAQSYALYNWKRINQDGPVTFDNIKCIRQFAGSSSENGFIMVHVAMVCLYYLDHLIEIRLLKLDSLFKLLWMF